MKKLLLLSVLIVCPGLATSRAAANKPPTPAENVVPAKGVVRVNSTNQSYDFARPWDKKSPLPRRGAGAILGNGMVLVTAELVANHNHLEIEKPLTADKSTAEVVAVDYDANLALLRPVIADFLKGLGSFQLAEGARVGDSAEILQIENNGEIARTPATLTTIAVTPYPLDSLSLLVFKLSSPLQSRDSSFVLPAVRQGKLLGLLMRYDARTQTADLVPSPVIRRFLERAEKMPYVGFGRLGLSFSSTRDPQLRSFLGLTQPGGIYITEVIPESPAALGGLRRGDIILEVDGNAVDQDGLYEDPEFGKILFTHVVTSRGPEAGPVRFKYLRDNTIQEVEVTPQPHDPTKAVSESHSFDTPPRYYILGGLIFQELSRTFLREWGANWVKSAPQRLVYLDAFQSELPKDRGKIVFLSGSLPSPDTIGYEGLNNLVVTRVNGIEIKSLDDIAKAAASPQNGFHKIEFEEDPKVIFLDAEQIEANKERLARDYGIPALQRL
ncbi:MAG: PDZ domain-containing protein [Terrimicrobiaceae bacterium]